MFRRRIVVPSEREESKKDFFRRRRQIIADPRIAGIERPRGGRIVFAGRDITGPGFARDIQSRHRSSCRGAAALSYFDRDGEFTMLARARAKMKQTMESVFEISRVSPSKKRLAGALFGGSSRPPISP